MTQSGAQAKRERGQFSIQIRAYKQAKIFEKEELELTNEGGEK